MVSAGDRHAVRAKEEHEPNPRCGVIAVAESVPRHDGHGRCKGHGKHGGCNPISRNRFRLCFIDWGHGNTFLSGRSALLLLELANPPVTLKYITRIAKIAVRQRHLVSRWFRPRCRKSPCIIKG